MMAMDLLRRRQRTNCQLCTVEFALPTRRQEAMEQPGSGGTNGHGTGAPAVTQEKKQRAKARWSILRNAILKSRKEQQIGSVSIHRFPGYQLIVRKKGSTAGSDTLDERGCIEERMLRHYFQHLKICTTVPTDNDSDVEQEFVDQLESIIGAILCLQCHTKHSGTIDYKIEIASGASLEKFGSSNFDKTTILQSLAERYKSMNVSLTWQSQNAQQGNKENLRISGLTLNICLTDTRENPELDSADSAYGCFYYPLASRARNSQDNPNHSSDDSCNAAPICSLWTREPVTSTSRHLSLDELVSHRSTGVDNTGNICVWDSERTLSYLLHQPDTLPSLLPLVDHNQKREEMPIRRILELGTGMAGLPETPVCSTVVTRLLHEYVELGDSTVPVYRYHMSRFYPNSEMTLPLSVSKAAIMASRSSAPLAWS